jgi:hypothetical protein
MVPIVVKTTISIFRLNDFLVMQKMEEEEHLFASAFQWNASQTLQLCSQIDLTLLFE